MKKTVNHGKTYQPQLVQDFHQQYDPLCHDSSLMTLSSLAMFLFDSLPLLFLIEDLGLLSDNRIPSSQHEAFLDPSLVCGPREVHQALRVLEGPESNPGLQLPLLTFFWGGTQWPEIWWLEDDPVPFWEGLASRASCEISGVFYVILGGFLWVLWNILRQHQHAFHFSKGPLFIPS